MPIKQNGSRLGAGWMLRSLWGLILGARQALLAQTRGSRSSLSSPHAARRTPVSILVLVHVQLRTKNGTHHPDHIVSTTVMSHRLIMSQV